MSKFIIINITNELMSKDDCQHHALEYKVTEKLLHTCHTLSIPTSSKDAVKQNSVHN